MDSDSDTEFYSETSIRKKLRKLVKCANRSLSQEDKILLDSPACSPAARCSDPDQTIKVIFPRESIEVHKFSVHRTDNFASVFKQLSDLKRVPLEQMELVLMPHCRDVSHYDSLDSLDYIPTHFFHAFVKTSPRSHSSNGTGNILLQCVTRDKTDNPLTFRMYHDQPLDVLMAYCARDLNRDRGTFKLVFDGDVVRPFDTCNSLEITDGETIEIHYLS